MAGAVERFRQAARARGLDLDIRTFPEGTQTAEAAASAVACDVAQIVKSLVFVADGQPILVLTSGANRADPERLAALAGASEVRRATPEEAREATGFGIGGTPPFGHPQALP
ncbi:MAG TPA: YbaK/EbsC family protein, partial [Acidimicrobiia bacterium]